MYFSFLKCLLDLQLFYFILKFSLACNIRSNQGNINKGKIHKKRIKSLIPAVESPAVNQALNPYCATCGTNQVFQNTLSKRT